MSDMLTNWTAQHSERFRKETLTFGHGLVESGLFTDDALIALMEKHPIEQLDVCSMSDDSDPEFLNQFMTGDFRGVPPKVLLEAAKAGRIFMNLRNAMNIHPEYKALLDKMFGDLSEKTGFENYKPKGSILISSPISQTPYHFDKTQTILWHVRGKKRMYIYPMTPEFIPDEAYEATAVSARIDDLPYDVTFDQSAEICDLEPGEAVAWPLNAPHRVDNGSFCVSVTTEYSTRECVIKNNNMLTNAALRGTLGIKPSFDTDGPFIRIAKTGAGMALRKLGYIKRNDSPDLVSFKIDPTVEGFVVRTDPYVRNF